MNMNVMDKFNIQDHSVAVGYDQNTKINKHFKNLSG